MMPEIALKLFVNDAVHERPAECEQGAAAQAVQAQNHFPAFTYNRLLLSGLKVDERKAIVTSDPTKTITDTQREAAPKAETGRTGR